MRRRLLACAVSIAVAAPIAAQDLTGVWCDDHATRYTMRQAGSDICWHMDGLPLVQNVFCGTVIGNHVVGRWLDLPDGRYLGGGQLILSIDSPDRLSKAHDAGGYGASRWTRAGSDGNCAPGLPPAGQAPRPAAAPPPLANAPPLPASSGAGELPPRPGRWRLVGLEQRGSMDDRPATPGDGGLRFDVRRFDATGGEVLATVTYAAPAICPAPETESILFRWSLPADIRYLAPGQEFAVDVSVEPSSQSRTCPGGVFGRSEVVVMRSEASIEDIPAAERPLWWPTFTHPYVKDPSGVRLNFYVGGAPTGRAMLHVNDEQPPTSSRRGSYSIRFSTNACCGTPAPANSWSFHYVYEY